MITEIDIDIFKQPCDALIHQCNCFGVMGGGIAKFVREKYPEAARADKDTDCGSRAKLGKYSCVKAWDGKYIYNMYSQYNYGIDSRHTDYEAFYVGLKAIKSHMEALGLTTAAIPHSIGCGLGGGSWPIIKSMIYDVFDSSDIELFICKYTP